MSSSAVRLLIAVLALAIATAVPEGARAEPPAIVPPRLVDDPGAVYPQAAVDAGVSERVEVVLIVEIDDLGNVVNTTVETPKGNGFDDAALSAGKRLRFEPATRDGKNVASRIRYRYVFDPPLKLQPTPQPAQATRVDAAPPTDATAPGPQYPAVAPTASPERPMEVSVHGERRAPAVPSYSREEVRRIPGAFGDPFRAIETLPGVTPLASGFPFFYLRGAPPGNVGYFLDGVRVPSLYHIGLGPSVVQPAIVRDVELYAGAYPARFGRFAGGIVSASTTEPTPDTHGEGVLRLFDAGGMVETGFADDRATVLVGGRYSYTAALLSLAAPNLVLDYHDYQARASYDLSPNDRVSVFGLGAYDLFVEGGRTQFASQFYRADLRYDTTFSGGTLRTAVTLGYDRTNAEIFAREDSRNFVDRSVAGRVELLHELGEDVALRWGTSSSADVYSLDGTPPRPLEPLNGTPPPPPEAPRPDADPDAVPLERFFPPRVDVVTGAYLELAIDVTPSIALMPGIRADLYGSGGESAIGVDPRLAVRFSPTESVRVLGAAGVAHQPPSFVIPLAGIAPALGQGLQRSIQTSAGVEVDLDRATTAGMGVFYNAFFNTTDAFATSSEVQENIDRRSRGAAFGVELFLRRRLTQRLGGFLSYTLSRSVRRIGSIDFVSGFDRTHVANAALSYDLGRRWRAGARGLYYTGTPAWGDEVDPIDLGTTNVPREPAFFRLDLRIEKRWPIRGDGWFAFVFEFLNATLHKETFPGGEVVGPISIPSLGLELGF